MSASPHFTSGNTDHKADAAPVTVLPVDEPHDQNAEDSTARFEEFHAANPAVYDAIVTLARRYIKATGAEHVSVQRCIEIARWDLAIASKGDEAYLINNNFGAYYARLVMLQEPDLREVFKLRRSHIVDNWIARVAARRNEAA